MVKFPIGEFPPEPDPVPIPAPCAYELRKQRPVIFTSTIMREPRVADGVGLEPPLLEDPQADSNPL
jgi:hypothetical protein